MNEDLGKCTGYSWKAKITLTDSKGITRTFTEKNITLLEIKDE